MHRASRSVARSLVGRTRSYATTATVHPPLAGLSPTARNQAERISAEFKGTSADGENTRNFIGGEFVESKAEKWIDVVDPVRVLMRPLCQGELTGYLRTSLQATQTLLTRVPETTSAEFDQAVDAAQQAFKTWSKSSVLTRQRFVLECV